jgi:tight adherence protein C
MNFELNNFNLVYPLLGVIIAILGLTLAIYGVSIWFKGGKKLVATRLTQFVGAEAKIPSNPVKSQIIPREIIGSFFSRTIGSWVDQFIQFLGRFTPQRMVMGLDHKLAIAGNPGNLNAGRFFAIRILMLMVGVFIALFINQDFKHLSAYSVGFGVLVIVACFFFPVFWLNGRVKSKQYEVRRELPSALDMLSVCADAGLGFDQSIQRISQYWDTELGHEFKLVAQELEMGVTRADALKNLSNRLDVEELTRFIVIIIQAEKIGMSYSDVLHSQALQMRVFRQYWAREISNKLPAKMVIPLAIFILPALIAVILGPIIPKIFNAF